MDTFLLALLLVFAISLGGKDQMVIAQFSDELERTGGLLWTGIACAAATAGIMTFAGASIAAMLPSRAADMLVAIALAFAAFEVSWRIKLKPMKEPTRSYVAIGIVLFIRQLGDAARFVVFALAAEATYPATTAIGGALGGAAAIGLGWLAGRARLDRLPLHPIRMAFGLGLIVAALFIGLNARYAIV